MDVKEIRNKEIPQHYELDIRTSTQLTSSQQLVLNTATTTIQSFEELLNRAVEENNNNQHAVESKNENVNKAKTELKLQISSMSEFVEQLSVSIEQITEQMEINMGIGSEQKQLALERRLKFFLQLHAQVSRIVEEYQEFNHRLQEELDKEALLVDDEKLESSNDNNNDNQSGDNNNDDDKQKFLSHFVFSDIENNNDNKNDEKDEKKENENIEISNSDNKSDNINHLGGMNVQELDCPICIDTYPIGEMHAISTCFHIYCKECLREYLNGKISTAEVENIRCPNPECSHSIAYNDIKDLVSGEVMSKYENFSVMACLRTESNVCWCPTCSVPILYDDEYTKETVLCPQCNQLVCRGCSQFFHAGQTCAENKQQSAPIDPKTLKWMKKHGTKPCPHCGVPTIRNQGCPDIRCTQCKKHWDWYHDEPDWEEDGLWKKSETKVEKFAFFYPRLVKQVMGSRDTRDTNNSSDVGAALVLCGIVGIAGIPATIVCSPPALTIRGGRKMKKACSKLYNRFHKNDNNNNDNNNNNNEEVKEPEQTNNENDNYPRPSFD